MIIALWHKVDIQNNWDAYELVRWLPTGKTSFAMRCYFSHQPLAISDCR